MKYIIRILMIPPVALLFGTHGVLKLLRYGGTFTAHGKDYKTISTEALRLLRALAEVQNDAPLEKYREEWERVMGEVWAFLEEHEEK